VQEVYLTLRSRSGADLAVLINGVRRPLANGALNDCVVLPLTQRLRYEAELLQAKKQAEAAMAAQRQAEATLKQQYERALVLGEITQQIRQSLHLPDIFAVAARAIHHCVEADRVGIFRFAETGEGGLVSEAVSPGMESMLAAQTPHQALGDHYRRARANGGALALRDLSELPLEEAQAQLFQRFQVRASLSVPVWLGEQLWGLIVLHQCSRSRYWQGSEIELIEAIAVQLAIAIQQADLVHRLQTELQERQRTEARLTAINLQLQRATGQLERLAHTDPLTQVANRRRFSDRLTQEWQRLSRDGLPLALLLFDVDYFKLYNDTYGHQAGDDCLYAIAQAAQRAVGRPTDLLARYGGEEFAVLLPATGRDGAIAVARNIHAAIAALALPHAASAVSDRITVSLGFSALVPSALCSSTQLIRQADRALYAAKRRGRNGSVGFEPALENEVALAPLRPGFD
jgi:diguanylate cyclase (GGDEF)-like protein